MLKEGDLAPEFSLPSDKGETVSLKDLRGNTVVLYFYPKDDTPGCTKESCDFRDRYADFQGRDIQVFGVSCDDLKSHEKFSTKFSLPFPLLSDTDTSMANAYGVYKEKSMYGRTYMGIERTTFVIGPDGNIRKIYPKVSVDGHVLAVLADLGF
ncbi:MAG: thioredoxin-dependent thiol peroxidase [candidate division Zixibacteria bacterium]|nr:thioredoxin-dependent thiol peroxidase [candidate division Zixibacteria bacterium]